MTAKVRPAEMASAQAARVTMYPLGATPGAKPQKQQQPLPVEQPLPVQSELVSQAGVQQPQINHAMSEDEDGFGVEPGEEEEEMDATGGRAYEPAAQQLVGNHLSSSHQRPDILAALGKHHQENISTVCVTLTHDVSLAELASGDAHRFIKLDPSGLVAHHFRKKVFNRDAGVEELIGDTKHCQVTEVRVLRVYNELPIGFGLSSPELRGGTAPHKVSANNGRSFPFVVHRDTTADFTLHGAGHGHLLYQNTSNLLPEKFFKQWGHVKLENLTAGTIKVPNTDETLLDIDKNGIITDILHANQDVFMHDFPLFNYGNLVEEVARGHRKVRIWDEVLQKAIDIGLSQGIDRVRKNTIDISSLRLELHSLTSPTGGFSDLNDLLARRYGDDQYKDVLERRVTVSFDIKISARVAEIDSYMQRQAEAVERQADATVGEDEEGGDGAE